MSTSAEFDIIGGLYAALEALKRQKPNVAITFMSMINNIDNPFSGESGKLVHSSINEDYYKALADVQTLIKVGHLAYMAEESARDGYSVPFCEIDSRMKEAILFCTRVHNSFQTLINHR